MCAALAARNDPAEELELAVDLVNRVVEGLSGVRTGIHVCRGNWSRNEETLLSGSYQPLVPTLLRMNVQQLVLEYATPRAGDLVAVGAKELGLGVVNPRTDAIETPEAVVARVNEALAHVPAERVFLNPDCGFGTFASRPMNAPEVARAKLEAMAQAADRLRQRRA
jgi:5-methyltetrahydropteroyltriglutamate--homocysteine methyltransferase